jgi:hypothetical protein
MGSEAANSLGGGVCHDDHGPDRRYGPNIGDLSGQPFKGFVTKCPIKYQDREKLPVKNKLTGMALDVQRFNGSLLEVRGMMLTGVTVEDIFRIAVARHLGKFKPNSNVPGEADMYLQVLRHIAVGVC